MFCVSVGVRLLEFKNLFHYFRRWGNNKQRFIGNPFRNSKTKIRDSGDRTILHFQMPADAISCVPQARKIDASVD